MLKIDFLNSELNKVAVSGTFLGKAINITAIDISFDEDGFVATVGEEEEFFFSRVEFLQFQYLLEATYFAHPAVLAATATAAPTGAFKQVVIGLGKGSKLEYARIQAFKAAKENGKNGRYIVTAENGDVKSAFTDETAAKKFVPAGGFLFFVGIDWTIINIKL